MYGLCGVTVLIFRDSSAAFIRGRHLLEGGVYPKAAFIRERGLIEGGFYRRAAFIRGRGLFEGGVCLKSSLFLLMITEHFGISKNRNMVYFLSEKSFSILFSISKCAY